MSQNFSNIGTVTTLLINLKKINYDKDTEVLFYRGHYDSEYKLIPSIYRKDVSKYINKEDKLFKELMRTCPNDFNECKSTFEELVKMQHYDLPTRLFDITSNPLVALFFACFISENESKKERKKHVDGELIIFKMKKKDVKYFDSDSVSVVSNIARRPADFKIPNKKDGTKYNDTNTDKKNFNKKTEMLYLLHEIKREKPHFLDLIVPSDLEKVFCVKPKLNNPRIIRQSGAFLLFGIDQEKEQPAKLNAITVMTIKVISSKKKNILEQLATLGITEGSLLPEIDKVSHYLSSSLKYL